MIALSEIQAVSADVERGQKRPPEYRSAASSRLCLSTEWVSAAEVRIVVGGEIDMSNADLFTMEVLRAAGNCRRLVLDLRGVGFFASAGCRALLGIDDCLRRMNAEWRVEPGRIVARTLDLCGLLTEVPISPHDYLPGHSQPPAVAVLR